MPGRARSREIAIRLSIGAGRSRVVRQLMTESLILAMAGAVAGLLVAYGGIRLLQTLSVPSDPPSVLGVELDWRVVEFSLLARSRVVSSSAWFRLGRQRGQTS